MPVALEKINPIVEIRPEVNQIRMLAFYRSPLIPAVLIWVFAALCGLVPPFSRDALNDHLMVPLLWCEHGLFWRDAWLSFTANPPLADIPYILFAGQSWDWLASVWHALGALITLLLLDRAMRHVHVPVSTRRWSLLIFMLTPIVVALCTWAYVDLWLCALAAALCEWLVRPAWRIQDAWAFGLFMGMGVLIKYNGLPLAVAAGLALAWRWRQTPILVWAYAWRSAVACLLIGGWWYAGNAWLLGHPLYPLGASENGIGWLQYRIQAYGEPAWWAMLAPLRQFFWGEINVPRLFDGMLHPLLLAGLVGAWIGRHHCRSTALFILSLVYALFALKVGVRARYWLPGMLPLWPLLAMALMRMRAGTWRVLAAASFLPGLVSIGLYLAWLSPWQFLLHGRDAYLQAHVRDYPIQRWASLHLRDDAQVYLLWLGGRAYYLRRGYSTDFGHEGARLMQAVEKQSSLPFTDVLMNRRLAERTLGQDLGVAWQRWLAHTCLIARHGDFELRKLAPCG